MLQKIKQKSGGLVIKIILALIGCSFVFFGVADVVRILTSTPPVARINRAKIQFQDFYSQYQQETHRLMQFLGGNVPKQILNNMPNTVLDRMINDSVLKQEMDKIGLAVPKEVVFNSIRAIPSFQENGEFDVAKYHSILRRVGLNHKAFASDMAKDLANKQFNTAITTCGKMNKLYIEILMETITNKKSFEIAFAAKDSIEMKQADEEDLKKYLKNHEDVYMVPEKRSIEIVQIPYQKIEETIPVDQQVLDNTYQERKQAQEQAIKESMKKTFHKLTCETHDDADAVKKSFFQKSLDEVKRQNPDAKVEEMSEDDIEKLGKDVRDMVKGLAKGETYGPLQYGKHEFVVYAVTDEKPSDMKILTDEEIKQAVEKDMKASQLPSILEDIKNKVEDAFSAGRSFDDIKNEYPIEKIVVNELTQKSDEAFLKNLEDRQTVISTAFSLDEGADSSFLDFKEISCLVHVVKIIPKHVPEFDVIKDKIKIDWEKEEKKKAYFEWFNNEFRDARIHPDQWLKTAQKAKCEVKTLTLSSFDLYQNKFDSLFDMDTWNNLMLFKNNQIECRETSDGRVVCVHVKDVQKNVAGILYEKETEQEKHIKKTMYEGLSQDISSLLTPSIRRLYRIKINEKSVNKVKQISVEE